MELCVIIHVHQFVVLIKSVVQRAMTLMVVQWLKHAYLEVNCLKKFFFEYQNCRAIKNFIFKFIQHRHGKAGMSQPCVPLFVQSYVQTGHIVQEKLVMMDVQQLELVCPQQVSESINRD